MNAIESFLLAYLINSLWQLPLLFCAALIAARLTRPLGSQIEHRIWVATLLLQTLLPLCTLRISALLHLLNSLLPSNAPAETGNVQTITMIGQPVSHSFFSLSPPLSHLLVLSYLLALAYFSLRFLWGLWRTLTLPNRALTFTTELSLPTPALLAISPEIAVPATMGLSRHTLLLPPGFVEASRADDLHALFAHESAHMRRRDFLKNLLYRFLSLPIAYHPLCALTQNRLAETREMICDSLAARELDGPQLYAQSLLRLAATLSGRKTPSILHAIGFLDANTFEKRIMNLTRNLQSGRLRKLLISSACTFVALAACTSALALRINIADEPQKSDSADKNNPVKIQMSFELKNDSTDKDKPTTFQVELLNRVHPVIPAEAIQKNDTLSGTVELQVLIDKDGNVQDAKVTHSLRADYDQSALDAARQWKYKVTTNNAAAQFEAHIILTFTKSTE